MIYSYNSPNTVKIVQNKLIVAKPLGKINFKVYNLADEDEVDQCGHAHKFHIYEYEYLWQHLVYGNLSYGLLWSPVFGIFKII